MNPEQTLVLVCGTGLLLCAATVYLAGVILGEWPRPFLRTVGAEADPWPTTLSKMSAGQNGGGGSSNGPATDRSNTPVQDPTPNVRDLVEHSIRRLDDLRAMSSEHLALAQDQQRSPRERDFGPPRPVRRTVAR